MLGNAAVAALPSPQHDAAHAQPVLCTRRREEFFTPPSEFLLPAGRETSASLLPGEHLRHTLSRRSTTHTLAAVDPALALPTGDLARPPRLGQDWSPCAASVVICGGHFLLPIHVSHSTASRGGTSEPQRVPTRPPASRSGGVSLLIRYHVEQGRGRALSGSGRPLARTSAGLARGSGGSRSQRSRVLHAIHCAAASPRPSKPRAWFADNRISLCASLRLPARRLLRARREAHPIGDRIEAPVQARQRCRRCPPEPSTRCRTLRNPFCAHAAGRSFHSSV